MSEHAIGIHADPVFKLGLLPARPAVQTLEVGDFLTGAIPKYPDNADYLSSVQYGNYANDRYGVCGPVSVANSRRMVTAFLEGRMVAPSQDDVFDLYRRSGNPNFDPATGQDDNGVIMTTMLAELVRGGIGGVKCLGFARVNIAKLHELDAAIAIFGAVLFGVNLQSAQQSQTNQGFWKYSPSGPWGGHAVMAGAFPKENGNDVITWGKRVRMMDDFILNQSMEAYVVIWPEHLRQKQFLESVDIWSMADAFETLTKRRFPTVLPPKPNPGPTVDPTPSGGWKVVITGSGPKPTVNVSAYVEPATDDDLPALES